jgi:hypothetical protein
MLISGRQLSAAFALNMRTKTCVMAADKTLTRSAAMDRARRDRPELWERAKEARGVHL